MVVFVLIPLLMLISMVINGDNYIYNDGDFKLVMIMLLKIRILKR